MVCHALAAPETQDPLADGPACFPPLGFGSSKESKEFWKWSAVEVPFKKQDLAADKESRRGSAEEEKSSRKGLSKGKGGGEREFLKNSGRNPAPGRAQLPPVFPPVEFEEIVWEAETIAPLTP